MRYLMFKLNLQPAKLFEYDSDSDKEYLIQKLVPTMLQHIVALESVNGKDVYKITLENMANDAFEKDYNRLLVDTDQLLQYYKDIYEHYKENEEIHYSKEFLNLNSRCSNNRRKLVKQYPVLENAFHTISDEVIDEEIGMSFDSKIGTGIVHLRKFYKLKKYIEEVGMELDNPLKVNAYYRPEDEKILIGFDEQMGGHFVRDARVYTHYLESLINNNNDVTSKIGKVSINPVYESITLDEDSYTEITFCIVYPNGNPSLDRHNILEAAEAEEVQYTIYGSDDRPLNKVGIESYINEEGGKGYLKNISTTKGKRITSIIKSITSF